jgi:hypothetical protein
VSAKRRGPRRLLAEALLDFGSNLPFVLFLTGAFFAGSLLLNQGLLRATVWSVGLFAMLVALSPLHWLRYEDEPGVDALSKR